MLSEIGGFMQLFKVVLGYKEFSVIGVADISNQTVKFQELINGIPFVEDENYETIREVLLESVELNQPDKNMVVQ